MRSRVEYQYFDIDHNARADQFVRSMNGGQRRYPVVVVGDQAVTNPRLAELRAMLNQQVLR